MRKFHRFIAACTALLAGCSVHPIPADVVHLSIYDLVHKVRCEARESVESHYFEAGLEKKKDKLDALNEDLRGLQTFYQEKLAPKLAAIDSERKVLAISERLVSAEIARLTNLLKDIVDAVEKQGEKTQREKRLANDEEGAKGAATELRKWLARKRIVERQIYSHNTKVVQLDKEIFTYQANLAALTAERRAKFSDLQRYLGHTFAYALRFEIEEQNDARISTADFTWPITNGTTTLGLAVGDKKLRKGKREVRVEVGFGELLSLKDACSDAKGLHSERADHVTRYPIRGRIGLDEVIDQYLEVQKKVKLSATADTGPTYRSILTFTTTIDASLKPSVTVTRSSLRRFNGASTLAGQRQDIHEVIVVIVPPPSPKEAEPDKTVNVRILNDETLLEDRP